MNDLVLFRKHIIIGDPKVTKPLLYSLLEDVKPEKVFFVRGPDEYKVLVMVNEMIDESRLERARERSRVAFWNTEPGWLRRAIVVDLDVFPRFTRCQHGKYLMTHGKWLRVDIFLISSRPDILDDIPPMIREQIDEIHRMD